jgi:hypothetical protein
MKARYFCPTMVPIYNYECVQKVLILSSTPFNRKFDFLQVLLSNYISNLHSLTYYLAKISDFEPQKIIKKHGLKN